MSFYDAFKDVISVAQKADNIELYRQLLDLRAQALDMQEEIAKLKEENAKLKEKQVLAASVERHKEPYITVKGDQPMLRYCSHCWDAKGILVQLSCNDELGTFTCPHCNMTGVHNTRQHELVFRNTNSGSFDIV